MKDSVHTLALNGVIYPIDQLPDYSSLKLEQEKAIVQFIQEWKSGQLYFELNTSGSTGAPKKIVISRDQMRASAQQTKLALSLEAGYTALLCLDARYIAGKMMLVRCLEIGMNIVAVSPSANPFQELTSNYTIDFVAFVPYQLQHILESDHSHRLNQLKCVIIGGASVDGNTQKQLQQYTCRFYATYGMTETVSHIALQKLNGPYQSSLFKALPGVKISVDDRGCLVAEADYILNGKVLTNDVVEMVSSQEFRWLGRIDNVINSGGVKIFPEAVESSIQKIFERLHIRNRFLLTAQKDAQLGERVVMIVEGKLELSPALILQELKDYLPPYHNPKDLIMLESFVNTDTGKINRHSTVSKIPHLAPQ